MASHSENVGGAVEPHVSRVPVIATNVGGLPDLVHDGVSGKLVSPRNPQALAAAIVPTLQNREKAERLTIEGNKMARHLFDVQRTALEVAQIYTTLRPRTA